MFFLTEARSHRVPARCVYRSSPSRHSFPRPRSSVFLPQLLIPRHGRSRWCVPSRSFRKIKMVCPQSLFPEDQDGVSPVALSPCLCASVRANVFRTEARSHRVPARCVYRSRPSRDSFPRPEIRTFSPSCSRGGRSNWCVPSCSSCSFSVPLCLRESQCFFLTEARSHRVPDHCVYRLHHCRDSLPRSKILTSSPSCSYHDAEDQHGVSPVAQGPSPPGLRGVSSECT
jgi:hypothetical protein